jgi:ornithine cyclodeaminase
MSFIVLSQEEVRSCITMKQAIVAMEHAFKEYYADAAVLPLRTPIAIAKEEALTLTMPAYLGQQDALGLKVVSIFPNNIKQNKPSINGLILLLNEQTGEAKAIMEAGYLTAMRTGAVSGLATQYLAKEEASHVAILGSGVQALTQLEAVVNVRPITKVSVWSRTMENAKKFIKQIEHLGFEIACYSDIKNTVREADIICTATSSMEPLVNRTDLKPGVHINAVGSHTPQMCEIHNNVMSQSLIVVDQLEAACAESGEIVSALKEKCIARDDILELGALVSGKNAKKDYSYSVFKSVGLAIQDISIAHAVYLNAIQKGLGTSVSLN